MRSFAAQLGSSHASCCGTACKAGGGAPNLTSNVQNLLSMPCPRAPPHLGGLRGPVLIRHRRPPVALPGNMSTVTEWVKKGQSVDCWHCLLMGAWAHPCSAAASPLSTTQFEDTDARGHAHVHGR